MIEQGFYIKDNILEPWWVMVFYNVKTEDDYQKVYGSLLAIGETYEKAQEAIEMLNKPNTGFISSDMKNRNSIIIISNATSFDEMFNTVTHEIKHLTEHISTYFGYNPKGEKAAYIQGEIGQKMYKAVALSICPKCNCIHN
jgi:hypothetical protein